VRNFSLFITLIILLISLLLSSCKDSTEPHSETIEPNNTAIETTEDVNSDPLTESTKDVNSESCGSFSSLCGVVLETTHANCQKNSSPQFSQFYTDLSKIKYIYPLGSIQGGSHEYQVFQYLFNNNKSDVGSVPVYAPVDMALEQFAHYQSGSSSSWDLVFRVSCEVTIRLGHIDSVVAAIEVLAPTASSSSATSTVKTEITFKAGDQIGSTAEAPSDIQVKNWQIEVFNTAVSNKFANPTRYAGSTYEHADCPITYYPTNLQSDLISLLGINAAGETSDCGSPSKDVMGSVQGHWHFSQTPSDSIVVDTDNNYATPLVIYPDAIHQVHINMLANKELMVKALDATYLLPSVITSTHCYEVSNANAPAGIVFLSLVDKNTLNVYYSDETTCPSSFPKSGV
jgi:hypothetical protein